MKHIFIVNPAAGKGQAATRIIPQIEAYFQVHPEIPFEIYVTKAKGDGRAYAESAAKTGEPIRFYACGGDGTLYEVVNGAYKYPNVSVGILPLGSGNDFARIFGGSDKLLDIGAQVHAGTRKFDLIDAGAHVAINQCSMGLDAEVCAKQAYFKKLPGVGGEFAYTMSLFYCLFRRLNSEFKSLWTMKRLWRAKCCLRSAPTPVGTAAAIKVRRRQCPMTANSTLFWCAKPSAD